MKRFVHGAWSLSPAPPDIPPGCGSPTRRPQADGREETDEIHLVHLKWPAAMPTIFRQKPPLGPPWGPTAHRKLLRSRLGTNPPDPQYLDQLEIRRKVRRPFERHRRETEPYHVHCPYVPLYAVRPTSFRDAHPQPHVEGFPGPVTGQLDRALPKIKSLTYNPPIRVAEEFAMLETCCRAGRLIACLPPPRSGNLDGYQTMPTATIPGPDPRRNSRGARSSSARPGRPTAVRLSNGR